MPKDQLQKELDNKVGYTDDGMVFFVTPIDINGERTQATFMWEPTAAMEFATKIIQAVQGVKNDSPRTDKGGT